MAKHYCQNVMLSKMLEVRTVTVIHCQPHLLVLHWKIFAGLATISIFFPPPI